MCYLGFDCCEMEGLVQSWNTWNPTDLQDLLVSYKVVGKLQSQPAIFLSTVGLCVVLPNQLWDKL